MSYIRRWSLLVLLLAVSGSSRPTVPTADRMASGLPPEVRLRKMHLVRPDLIPYPIAIEVYC